MKKSSVPPAVSDSSGLSDVSATPAAAQTPAAASSARRWFITRSAALLPLATGLSACDSRPAASGSAAAAAPSRTPSGAPEVPDTVHSPRYFSDDEWRFVRAAVARLVPADHNGPGALELNVPTFIDTQMEGEFGHAARWYMQGPYREASPLFGYQSRLTPREVYRLGIAATNRYCVAQHGQPFAALPAAVQDTVLQQLDDSKLKFDDVDGKTFFDFLRENTIEGYLADPMHGGNKDAESWKMIGFPGARADFLEFVGKNQPYPYSPVSILGKEQ
ncbi:gluconate 2-dehydrogenase subunit 3 family protein [Paraburkholderia bonniea]|uniref:gluconate 2-dehydrogenase subunit 3 family protein n=1 Tax=Paraburkholderia bonniea TaxID=2152891 RepID=UPI001291795C|nr:gluconate 2-dehydrogenase subunit 3 family protein [Paraburkholderia bonniea]WJF89175.1 gluconate 2-dehydrogenase subunit 3 family protein [Paraburkholderia bonniea]WJF92491.1 gluconate 2-dehydrogenase subunit 3 family protein [Paraburkholderia bonniea]